MGLKTAIFLILILAPLAALQYRWVGKVSQAEHQRMSSNLNASVARFTEVFDRELTRAFLFFLTNAPHDDGHKDGHFDTLLKQWAEETEFSGLIEALYWVDRSDHQELRLSRFDHQSRQFASCSWPENMIDLAIPARHGRPKGARKNRSFQSQVLDGSIPALCLPSSNSLHSGPPFGRMGRFSEMQHGNRLIITLDLEYLRDVLFPELCRRHINPVDASEYTIVVRGSENPSEASRPNLFKSDSEFDFDTWDAQASLFALRHFPELTGLFRSQDSSLDDHNKRHSNHFPRQFGITKNGDSGLWMVQVSHSSGSLETAVQITRWRNLFFNFGALAVLGLSIGLIMRSTHRARRLANQQLEFVAGVSHELLTPLSAIQSAAQNLADGLVKDPDKVKNYGTMIWDQGSRLTGMVENVLDFAGMHTERKTYTFRPLAVKELVHDVLNDCRSILEKSGGEVVLEIGEDLPPIRGDLTASKQILHNLVANAAKYGGEKPKLTIFARLGENDSEVQVTVQDEGPGIPPDEIPFLFEPFFRGKTAQESQIQGSGLGLCLVKNMIAAQGGRISVSEGLIRGSAFTAVWQRFDSPDEQTCTQ